MYRNLIAKKILPGSVLCLALFCWFDSSAGIDTILTPLMGSRWLAQNTSQAAVLRQDAPLTRRIAPGESVEYSIQLDRKQFLSVAIIHLGLVLDISIVGPNGLTLKEIRGSPEAKTLISVIAPLTGTYRLLLSSRNEDGGAKNMKLQIDVIRPAAPTDTKRISAADAFAEAESLQRGGNSESCSSAIDKYEVALQVWRQTGDKREEASALRNIGRCHYLLGDPTKALDNATQALKISRGIGDGWGAAIALNDMVYASIAIGELEHTDVHLDEALRLSSEAGNRRAEAQALHNRGEVRYEKG